MTLQSVQLLSVVTVFAVFAVAEVLIGKFFAPEASTEDNRLDLAVGVMFPVVSGLVFAAAQALCAWLLPNARDAWAHWSWWQMVLMLLVADDLTQYLWHRLSHTSFMWPLHRAHHSAAYMSVRVVYRNNAFYYALMPGLWLSGALLYLGFGWIFVGYSIVKLTVIIGAHSAVRWDRFLYRYRVLQPVAWVLERTISTPATHFAHHALTQDDGIGHYIGNYGNLLFLWDVLFGTALITRQYPPAYGLKDDRRHGSEKWYAQLLFPVFRSKRAETVLGHEKHVPID
ncbi:MAG: sterol desaturase family protein [Gemmatimonadaceae bacterium]|nr:sterol desaturase family protein [Gemmatimonadaceae bacterium]